MPPTQDKRERERKHATKSRQERKSEKTCHKLKTSERERENMPRTQDKKEREREHATNSRKERERERESRASHELKRSAIDK